MKLFDNLLTYDTATLYWFRAKASNATIHVAARVTSYTADGYLYVVTGLCCLAVPTLQQVFYLLLQGFACERPLYWLMKNSLRRCRPMDRLCDLGKTIKPSDRFSLPSGHTSAAFLFAGIISGLFPLLAWVLYPWAVCVGLSRVVLGVHYPTDIVVGAGLGHLLSLWIMSGSLFA